MDSHSVEYLDELIAEEKFEKAADAINRRYRAASGTVLKTFEEFITVLAEPSLAEDLKNIRSLLRLGSPSLRSRLRDFLHDGATQNCLTAVLRNVEKNVPKDVRMSLKSAASYFRETEFTSTYQEDIVQYEPEFSKLTDSRLARLISAPPNILDMGSLKQKQLEKKEEVEECYKRESREPIKATFGETLGKCTGFFRVLDEFSGNFSRFYQNFRASAFEGGEQVVADWMTLGDDYFHIEVSKSSLMLPISPKALYWGMQDDYPETLRKLGELKDLVTPSIGIAGPEDVDGEHVIGILCGNPETVKSESLEIDLKFHHGPTLSEEGEGFTSRFDCLEPLRSYEIRIVRHSGGDSPLLCTMTVKCDAHFYAQPFVLERALELR